MARVLVTGMSGTGKSSLLDELSARGIRTVDTDYDDWLLADGTLDTERMTEFLGEVRDVVVQATVENQGEFAGRFEHVVLLSAPLEVLLTRVRKRRNNPYGSTAEQRAEIARHWQHVEPRLRAAATAELDGRRPIEELADEVERMVRGR